MTVNLGQDLDHLCGFFGEDIDQIDEVSSAVRQAVAKNACKLGGHVPGEGIAHLDRGTKIGQPLIEKVPQVFTGMFVSRKKAGYRLIFGLTNEPRCKDTLSFSGLTVVFAARV